MTGNDLKLLQDFTLSAQGKAALGDLLQTLETETGPGRLVSAENDFLIAAAQVTGEASASYVTGQEKQAHQLLHLVLTEHQDQGVAGLQQLRKDLNL